MSQVQKINIFQATTEELEAGIQDMNTLIDSSLQKGDLDIARYASSTRTVMIGLLEKKQGELTAQKSSMTHNYNSASVVVTDAMALAFHAALSDSALGSEDVDDIKAGLRAALINFNVSSLRLEIPPELNEQTAQLVINFASALAEKLLRAQQKYGRGTDWAEPNWGDDCLKELHRHLSKGDPRDVAAYCMFMWYHGWLTTSAQSASAALNERTLFDGFMKDDYSPDTSGSVTEADEKIFLETLFHIWQARAAVQNGLTQEEMDVITAFRQTKESMVAEIVQKKQIDEEYSQNSSAFPLVQIQINVPVKNGLSAEFVSKLKTLSTRLKATSIAFPEKSVEWLYHKDSEEAFSLKYSACTMPPGYFPDSYVCWALEDIAKASYTTRTGAHEFILLLQGDCSVTSKTLASYIDSTVDLILAGETSGMDVNHYDGYAFMLFPAQGV